MEQTLPHSLDHSQPKATSWTHRRLTDLPGKMLPYTTTPGLRPPRRGHKSPQALTRRAARVAKNANKDGGEGRVLGWDAAGVDPPLS